MASAIILLDSNLWKLHSTLTTPMGLQLEPLLEDQKPAWIFKSSLTCSGDMALDAALPVTPTVYAQLPLLLPS